MREGFTQYGHCCTGGLTTNHTTKGYEKTQNRNYQNSMHSIKLKTGNVSRHYIRHKTTRN